MIGVLAVKIGWSLAWVLGALSAAIDNAWATPVNTLLLLITLIVGGMLNRKLNTAQATAEQTHEVAQEVKEIAAHAANASANAAEAAATAAERSEAAARITRELGRAARSTEVPAIGEPGE